MRISTAQLGSLIVSLVAAACTGTRPSGDAAANATSGGSASGVAAPVAPRELRLATGAALVLESRTEISSRRNHTGDPVTAAAGAAVLASGGDTVIPRGATFYGRVTALAPAPHPSEQGVLRIRFNEVRIGDRLFPVRGEVTSLGTEMRGRGVTAGTAAKVGAGAVIGGVAGRLIGGNATGTVIGAVAGGAGGAVVAHATRTMDIVLPAGARIRLQLTEPFERAVATGDARSGREAAARTPARDAGDAAAPAA